MNRSPLTFRPNLAEAALEERVLPAPYSLLPAGAASAVNRPAFASGQPAVGSYAQGNAFAGGASTSLALTTSSSGPSSGPGGGGANAPVVFAIVGVRYFGSGYLYGVNFGFPVGLTSGPNSGGGGGAGYGGESGADPAGSPSGPPANGIDTGLNAINVVPGTGQAADGAPRSNSQAPNQETPMPMFTVPTPSLMPQRGGWRDHLIHPPTPPPPQY